MTQRVLVTGAGGYIGSTIVDQLLEHGHSVIGLDRYFFGTDLLGPTLQHPAFFLLRKDVRDFTEADLEGVDAVFDLAGLSNDPCGALDENLTYAINHQSRADIARKAKACGVRQYVLASSCSVYGAGEEEDLTENSSTRPLSTYAKANLMAEGDVLSLSSPDFVVTVLRQATVFGLSKRMRFDLVVNLMTINAVQKGKIFILGGGKQWRPLVHVKDTASVFLGLLSQPASAINGEIFNVGSSEHNYQVLNIAYIVRENLPFRVELEVVPDDNDSRNYKVSFEKIHALGFKPTHPPAEGVREIYEALKLGRVDSGPKTVTVGWYRHLIEAKGLVDSLEMNGRVL